LLFFVTFFTAHKFCKLLFIVERGKVCYFLLLLITLINYFLPLRRARVYILFHCVTRERVYLDFFPFFFLTIKGEGGEG